LQSKIGMLLTIIVFTALLRDDKRLILNSNRISMISGALANTMFKSLIIKNTNILILAKFDLIVVLSGVI
jgi:hypothetical protein